MILKIWCDKEQIKKVVCLPSYEGHTKVKDYYIVVGQPELQRDIDNVLDTNGKSNS